MECSAASVAVRRISERFAEDTELLPKLEKIERQRANVETPWVLFLALGMGCLETETSPSPGH